MGSQIMKILGDTWKEKMFIHTYIIAHMFYFYKGFMRKWLYDNTRFCSHWLTINGLFLGKNVGYVGILSH